MFAALTTSPVWHLLCQTDFFTKLILASLLLLSLVCLAVSFYKLIELSQEKKQLNFLLTRLTGVQTFYECKSIASSYTGITGHLFSQLVHEIQLSSITHTVTTEQKEKFSIKSDHFVQQAVASCEAFVGLLASSGAVSPLVGLFGTVWGLIHSFLIISLEKSADIATVAPGIAEALMTTLAGLMVAIPALIASHYCVYAIRSLEQSFYQVADLVLLIATKEKVREEELCHDIVASRAAHL